LHSGHSRTNGVCGLVRQLPVPLQSCFPMVGSEARRREMILSKVLAR
jgi:hypothetical protein